MYCTNCGQPRPDDAVTCPNCNAAIRRPAVMAGAPVVIPNYLVQSVLVTLCCCLPLGVVAIVNSAQVDSRLAAGDIAGAHAKIKKLRSELREAQQKRDEYLAGWQREKADAINGRKEALADADRRAERLKHAFVEELIPVLDSFDMATGSESWPEVNDGFRTGMEHVHDQLLEVLESNGVKRFGKIGERFDPRLHEAVQEVDDTAGASHEIVKVLRSGYREGEKILRPAQVIVKK